MSDVNRLARHIALPLGLGLGLGTALGGDEAVQPVAGPAVHVQVTPAGVQVTSGTTKNLVAVWGTSSD